MPDLQRRFAAVLAHIDAHNGHACSLEQLATVAAYSPCHFHRQFGALTGLTVHRYVLFARMKQAAYLLVFETALPVGEIAARCGYDGPEAFARAFRQLVGVSPSEFRATPDWSGWNMRFAPYFASRSRLMNDPAAPREVTLVQFPPTPVGLLTHRGDLRRLNDSIARFIAWRRRNGLAPRVSATFNLFFDDQASTPAAECRLGLCAATTRPIEPNEEGVVALTIPGGTCARLRHVGSDDLLENSVRHLYAHWLPASGREPRDFPPFVQRIAFYPEVPEAEAITDIFLPLQDLPS